MLGAFLLCLAGSSFAQEDSEEEEAYVGGMSLKYSASVVFGNTNTLWNTAIPSAASNSTYWNISGAAPGSNVMESEASIISMTGVEAKVSITDLIAVRIGGSAIVRNTPGRDNVPGVIDPASPNVTWIPNYEAVTADNKFDMNMSVGGEYTLVKKDKISAYAGAAIPFYYSRWTQYDPTIFEAGNGDIIVKDVSERHIEAFGFGFQALAGVNYNISENFYLGFEVKPFSFLYTFNEKFAAAGLETLQADTRTRGYFTQPVFKLGFNL